MEMHVDFGIYLDVIMQYFEPLFLSFVWPICFIYTASVSYKITSRVRTLYLLTWQVVDPFRFVLREGGHIKDIQRHDSNKPSVMDRRDPGINLRSKLERWTRSACSFILSLIRHGQAHRRTHGLSIMPVLGVLHEI
jgi:hypothetical protein